VSHGKIPKGSFPTQHLLILMSPLGNSFDCFSLSGGVGMLDVPYLV